MWGSNLESSGLRLCRIAHLLGAKSSSCNSSSGAAGFYLVRAPVAGQLLMTDLPLRRGTGTLLGQLSHQLKERGNQTRAVFALAYRWNDDEIAEEAVGVSFKEAVRLFNAGEYYRCHDVLESLWNRTLDPQRSILHGILQCAVGLYHLLHQNHRGAMVEMGEGLTKLRRVGFGCGPLHDFEKEASAVLEFVYNTQLEYAACSDDMCITMDGSERCYQLLGNFGSGQHLYRVAEESDGFHIEFSSQQKSAAELGFQPPPSQRVKVPLLQASEEDLYNML